jgi:hypothetical protein
MPENLIDLYSSSISRQFEVLVTALKGTSLYDGSSAFSYFIASEMVDFDHHALVTKRWFDEHSDMSKAQLSHEFDLRGVFPTVRFDFDYWWEALNGTELIMEAASEWEEASLESLGEILANLGYKGMHRPEALYDLLRSDEICTIVDRKKLHDRVKDILLTEELDAICQDVCEQIAEITDVSILQTVGKLLSDDEKKFLKELPELRYRNRAVVLAFALKFTSSR